MNAPQGARPGTPNSSVSGALAGPHAPYRMFSHRCRCYPFLLRHFSKAALSPASASTAMCSLLPTEIARPEERLHVARHRVGHSCRNGSRTWNRAEKRFTERALSRAETFQLVKRHARPADLSPAISCHSFRATRITAFLQGGGSLELAQRLAGHASPRTTSSMIEHPTLSRRPRSNAFTIGSTLLVAQVCTAALWARSDGP
jgi:hypothetical protein